MASKTSEWVADLLTAGPASKELGLAEWQLRRLYERGLVPAAARLGGKRIISRSDFPAIRQAALAAGYLESTADIVTV